MEAVDHRPDRRHGRSAWRIGTVQQVEGGDLLIELG